MIRGAFFLVATSLLTFALLEGVGRVFDPLGISYYPETAAFLDTLVREEPIGYRGRPNLERNFWGAPLRFNSLGLREREIEPRRAGEFRIVVLGDSLVFGVGVRAEQTIPRQLEGQLNRASGGSPRFLVLNLGIPSYNTEQERIQFEALAPQLDPDLVLLFFTANDLESKMWVFDRRSSWAADLGQRSYAVSLLARTFLLARARFGAPRGAGRKGSAQEVQETRRPGLMQAQAEIARIVERCRERGASFMLFTANPGRHWVREAMEEVGRRLDVPVAEVHWTADPRWKDAPRHVFVNSKVDSHPNPDGSRAIATLVAESLARHELVPVDLPTP